MGYVYCLVFKGSKITNIRHLAKQKGFSLPLDSYGKSGGTLVFIDIPTNQLTLVKPYLIWTTQQSTLLQIISISNLPIVWVIVPLFLQNFLRNTVSRTIGLELSTLMDLDSRPPWHNWFFQCFTKGEYIFFSGSTLISIPHLTDFTVFFY